MCLKRTICCCGASTWINVLACIQIVSHTISLTEVITAFVAITSESAHYKLNGSFHFQLGQYTFKFICDVLGIITAIFLIKGTNQKRIGYLRVWLIYGGIALAHSIRIIARKCHSRDIQEDISGYSILSVEIALYVFAILVVCIHTNEINEGVFDLQPKQSVTTALERKICCVGASVWTTFIAWIQIIANTTNLIQAIDVFSSPLVRDFRFRYQEKLGYRESGVLLAAVVISIIFSFLGIIMGIILIKGTNQKRVGYLRAWLIYGLGAVTVSVILIIVMANFTTIVLYHVVLEVAFNMFSLVVIYIHMKEINEGVFDLQPKQLVTMTEP